jgi:hypothetical protein
VFYDMPAHNEVEPFLDIGRTDVPTVKADPRFLLAALLVVAGIVLVNLRTLACHPVRVQA